MATIITMIITFITTGIDEMLVLILLFAHAKKQKQIGQIYIGQQIGMAFLLLLALIAVYGISFFSSTWVGLLGLLPIIIGVMAFFEKDGEDDSDSVYRKTSLFSNLTLRVAIIAIAGGAEELAIYVPYFSSLDSKELLIATLTFLLMVPIWSAFCNMFVYMKNIPTIVHRYQRIIIPIVFIGIGLKVILEGDTIEAILDLFL